MPERKLITGKAFVGAVWGGVGEGRGWAGGGVVWGLAMKQKRLKQ